MLRNKKYGMGGAVQSFSSPMLAQGMQGSLSGFGTSGLGTFADGGQVRVVKKDEGNYWYRRTEGAIGSFAWRYDKNYNEGILFPLDKFYSDFYKNVKLKQGEVLFRYETDRMMGRMQPLIKFNLDKSLIYFGVDSDEDEPNFETKGIKAEYIVLEEGYDSKFAKGGQVGDFAKKNIGKKVRVNFRKEQGVIVGGEGDFVNIEYPTLGFTESVNAKLEPIYFVQDMKYAKGGEMIDQYEGRTPADIWFNLTKSQRRHLLLDHANIPSGELSSYIGDDTSFDELPHFVKQIVKKHFAEGQYARGGKLSPAQERAFFGKTKTKFTESDAERLVGKFIEIYGQGQDEPIAFSKIAKATIDPKYSQKTLVIYTEMGTQERIPEDKIDAFFNGLTIVLSIPSKGSYYGLKLKKEAYKYANGGEIHNSAKKMSDKDFEMAYNKLTPSEKNEVKSLIRLGDDKKLALATILAQYKKPSSSDFYKRAYEYANGGEITHLPEAKKVSKEDIEQFIRYVDSFYGKNGVYADYYEGVNSKAQIRKAVMTYLNKLDSQQTWGGGAGDSLDRERVGQILKPTSKPTYAKGGDVEDRDRFNSARTMGRNSQDWEAELKEYAGEHYNSLTRQEREEIIADMQRDFDRNTHFADGGVVIYKETDLNRRDGKTKIVQVTKVDSYREALERIEELKNNNKNTNVRFFTGNIYAKGGQTSTYEVHLEAVPNRDFDQSSHEANVRVPKLKKSAKSVDQAVAIAKKFIQDNDLGGSNFLPAKLYKNGKQVGFISYNGRVWNSDQSEMKYAQGGEMESEDMDVQFIEYKDNEIMYEPHYKKYYANDVEFDSLKDAQKFLDSGKISNDIRGAYQRGLFAKGGQTNAKRSKITLIMDGQKYSYPVAIVNGQVEITDETFKDGVLREYLDKEFDLWLDQAPSDYEEMYYGDESIMSKRGAIEGAMEYVSLTIEDEAPKKTTFNFDEGDIEFDSAYEYERGGSIAVSDDEKRKSLKGNLKIKF